MAEPTPQSIQLTNQQAQANTNLTDSELKLAEALGKRAQAGEQLSLKDRDFLNVAAAKLKSQNILNDSVTKGVDAIKNVVKELRQYVNDLGGSRLALNELMNSTKQFTEKNGDLINSLSKGYFELQAYRHNVLQTSETLKGFVNDAGGGAKAVQLFGEAAKNAITDKFGSFDLGKKIAAMVDNFFSAAAGARAFETSILRVATAGGSTQAILKIMGRENESLFNNTEGAVTAVAHRIHDLGMEAGITAEEASQAVMETMKTLPKEIGQSYDFINQSTQNLTLITEQLLFKLAAGTGTSFKEVSSIAASMAGSFGSSAMEASERVAVMSKAVDDLKIPFGSLKGLTDDLDKSFELWGDQSQKTIGILNNVSRALEGTGVGFKGQIDIVSKVTSAIGGMSLGMRSFIGVQGGLRGGAVGAGLQIEKMLQDGKMDEIAAMMQQTIEKRTGRGAVTLEQAAENPQLQNTFLQQRALLSSMKIEGEATQNRVLEIMSKGNIGGAGGADAGAELKKALIKGDNFQESQRNDVAVTASNTGFLKDTALNILIQMRERSAFSQSDERIKERKTELSQLSKESAEGKAPTTFDHGKIGLTLLDNLTKSISGSFNVIKSSVDDAFKATIAKISKSDRTEEDKKKLIAEKTDKHNLQQSELQLYIDLNKPGVSEEEISERLKNVAQQESKSKLGTGESRATLGTGESRATLGTRGAGVPAREADGAGTGSSNIEGHMYVHIMDSKENQVGVGKGALVRIAANK